MANLWHRLQKNANPLQENLATEVKGWLAEVTPSSKRAWFEKRLARDEFKSAYLELLFHHHFVQERWEIEWDPRIPGTNRTPEFRARRAEDSVLVEARVSGQDKALNEQDQVNNRIRNAIKTGGAEGLITFGWDSPPPPLSRLDEVLAMIASKVTEASNHGAGKTRRLELRSRGSKYHFWFDVEPAEELFVVPSATWTGGLGYKLYEDIETKVHRYGKPSDPFVIVVWPLGPSAAGEALKRALYGTRLVAIDPSPRRGQSGRQQDGIFSDLVDGLPSAAHISAVGAYQQKRVGDRVEHRFRLYHNHLATHPLPESTFEGDPQFVRRGDTMVWIPEDPDP